MLKLFRIELGILVALAVLASCGGGGGSNSSAASQTQTAGLKWYGTCGDPVCSGYGGPFPGVPLCTTERQGDACTMANAQCDPKSMCNARLLCSDRDPRQQAGGCPVSRALFKQDIRYLSDAQKKQIYQEIQALKLATYRYKDAAPNGTQRLGFLIDDAERHANSTLATSAVDAERDQVDLYSYVSMAVAALQIQARQIEALQAKVELLREAKAKR
jgi:hypothetical protein